jgi:hypothetical protein
MTGAVNRLLGFRTIAVDEQQGTGLCLWRANDAAFWYWSNDH